MTTRARVRDGDPDAFGELFDECARAVYNHAFRLTGNWSTAEEAVALTFLEAWRLRGKVDLEGGPLRPWLLGIATNMVRNFTRASRRYSAAVSRIPPPEAIPDFADELAGRLDDTEQVRFALSLVNKLRRNEREIFALCVWSGLDNIEAAEALGIPVGTVKSRLSRARAKLRKLVEESGEPDVARGQSIDNRESAARPDGVRQS
ncbi:RNA polymerase sigma factor [Fodinicola feengrottensis]|nr:RNA polymerase sigma factor [Fodinicola feengrottensis]